MNAPIQPRTQCVATRPRLDGGAHRCRKMATHGEWCRMHAQSLGGWVLVPPDPENYRGLASSFWVHYRCGMVGCRTVEPHEHGGGPVMRQITPDEIRAVSVPPETDR